MKISWKTEVQIKVMHSKDNENIVIDQQNLREISLNITPKYFKDMVSPGQNHGKLV